ncbi:hypothetical protein YB2330_006324 [Saitoella coloradoensis]
MSTSSLPSIHQPGTFHLPGITSTSQQKVRDMIRENHEKHHIFFKTPAGLHNHLSHYIYAAHSLGASTTHLQRIYEHESSYQKPMPKRHERAEGQGINRQNFGQHLGDEEWYPDYLDFFTQEIQSAGNHVKVFKEWVFGELTDGDKTMGKDVYEDFFARWFSGAYHPFIHTGYALEFDDPLIMAEGLAQAAVHSARMGPLLLPPIPHASSLSPLEIMQQVREEKGFDAAVKYDDGNKSNALLSRTPDLVRKYAAKWSVPANRDAVELAWRSLQQVPVALLGGSSLRPGKAVKMDFFLMHAVTSSLFLPIMIKVLDVEQGRRMLEAKWSVDLMYYISRGRPQLSLDLVESYPVPDKTGTEAVGNPWLGIVEKSLHHTDGHVMKAVRALLHADHYASHSATSSSNWTSKTPSAVPDTMYLKVAQMVVDGLFPEKDKDWDHSGIGFDEAWQKVPNGDVVDGKGN